MKYLVAVRSIPWLLVCCVVYTMLRAQLPVISTTRVGELEAEYRNAITDAQRDAILDQLNKAGFKHIADRLHTELAVDVEGAMPLMEKGQLPPHEKQVSAPEPVKAIAHIVQAPHKAGAEAPFSLLEQLELDVDKVLLRASTIFNDNNASLQDIDEVVKQVRMMSAKLEKEPDAVKNQLRIKIGALTQKARMFELKRAQVMQRDSFNKQIDQIKGDIAKVTDFAGVRKAKQAIDLLLQQITSSSLDQMSKDGLYQYIKKDLEQLLDAKIIANPSIKQAFDDLKGLQQEAYAVDKKATSLLLEENPSLQDIDNAIEAGDVLLEKLQKNTDKVFFKEEIKVLLERRELLEQKGAQQVRKLKK